MRYVRPSIVSLICLSFLVQPLLLLASAGVPQDRRRHLARDAPLEAHVEALKAILPDWDNNRQTYVAKKARRIPFDALLPNFDRVSARIYRGGQPVILLSGAGSADGIKLLKMLGVTDIIDLRNPGGSGQVELECKRSEEVNIAFHSIPMASYDIGIPIAKRLRVHSVAYAVGLLKKLEADDKKIIYIHCTFGADRTGVAIAMFRLYNGARLSVAMAEARDHYRRVLSEFQIGMHHLIRRNASRKHFADFKRLVDESEKQQEVSNCAPKGWMFFLGGRHRGLP